jgi:predicted phosphodiesterase
MKIAFISDTHNKHKQIPEVYFEGVDMVIHAGDVSGRGYRNEILPFLDWFEALPVKHKIMISGNHDFYFEQAVKDEKTKADLESILKNRPSIIYLNDSGVEIEGIKIWGSPVQPWFYNWAFNRMGIDIQAHWDLIPSDTQLLITHGPIQGYLDLTLEGKTTGCPYLKQTIADRLKDLKLHAAGHIHEAYGHVKLADGLLLINASLLDENYVMTNKPIFVEYDKDKNEFNVIQ